MMARVTHIDGKLPNLANMKISHWLKSQGYGVRFTKRVRRELDEPDYDRVYGSAIFTHSADRVRELLTEFPDAVVGGTWDPAQTLTVEQMIGVPEYEHYDYSLYPGFTASMGFTARGCRLRCGFCVVPTKEGRPRSVNTIADIWRGDGHPKHLHLLDNDFFGQPREQWRARVAEIRDGGFRVCLNQGINIRVVDDEAAEALASVSYSDDSFKVRRLYTAWDNLKDERIFLRGVERLEKAGVPPRHLLVYMLVGWEPQETWARVMRRFNAMVALGIRPYPMIYGDRRRGLPSGGGNADYSRRTLADFQRWAIRKSYNFISFEAYDGSAKGRAVVGQMDLFSEGR
jgi:hypothetical protein